MKIILVDEHALVRKGLTALLSQEEDIQVEGETESLDHAVILLRDKKPDITILNNRIGNSSGLELIKKVGGCGNGSKFIILASAFEEFEFRQACTMGVEGYLLKNVLPEELLYAIRLVYRGRKYYDPAIVDFVVRDDTNSAQGLTPRELQVLSALGQGMSNSLIANKLYITEFTVKKHISQILSKLSLRDRTEAALYANSKGMVNYTGHIS